MHSIIAYSNNKKLKYYDTIVVEYLLKRENEEISELLSHGQIIENVIRNNIEDEVEDDSSVLESVSHKDAFKIKITLYNILLK
jgi:hypothetical protein